MAMSSGVIVPNLTGFLVRRCAVFHSAAYCSSPAADRPDDRRHDARLEEVVQDVAGRIERAAAARRRRLGVGAVEARHVMSRIGAPALAADILVEARVAVGDDVETGKLLGAQIRADRVGVLLAEAAVDHSVEEGPRAQILGVPAGPRQRADDRRRQYEYWRLLVTFSLLLFGSSAPLRDGRGAARHDGAVLCGTHSRPWDRAHLIAGRDFLMHEVRSRSTFGTHDSSALPWMDGNPVPRGAE